MFRVSGRESSTNSFSRGYMSYNALTLTYVHNSGSEVIAEGAGNRWGSRYYFHNMTFEYQGGQRGIYIRFDMKPPEGFVPPPEILPAARLGKDQEADRQALHRRGAGAPPRRARREVAWALIARAVFNIVASDFYDQNGWRELTTKNCVFGSGTARPPRRRAHRVRDDARHRQQGRRHDHHVRQQRERQDHLRLRAGEPAHAARAKTAIAEPGGAARVPPTRASSCSAIRSTAAPRTTCASSIRRRPRTPRMPCWSSTAITTRSSRRRRRWRASPAAPTTRAASTCSRWPSVSASLRYLQDVDNAEEAEGSLQAFLAAILRDNNIHTLDIVAHSMGSQQLMRVMGSIRSILDGRRQEEGSLHLGQVVFAAPDVSAAVFNTKILTWAKLAQRVTIYTSGGDWVLWLSSFLRGLNDRAGGHTPWGEPLYVNASNVYVIDKTPPEYDYWKFFKYTHADYVDDKVILNDIQTVITGKPAGDPSKRDPEGKVFKVMSYKGIAGKTYWETLPGGSDGGSEGSGEGRSQARRCRHRPPSLRRRRNAPRRSSRAASRHRRATGTTRAPGSATGRHSAPLDAAAAVDLEGDAGDERRRRVGEEHRRVGDVVRARQPARAECRRGTWRGSPACRARP